VVSGVPVRLRARWGLIAQFPAPLGGVVVTWSSWRLWRSVCRFGCGLVGAGRAVPRAPV